VIRVVHDSLAHTVLNRRTVAAIQERVIKKGKRNLLSRLAHAKNDKETLASWRSDLNRILHVFNVRFGRFCSTIANVPPFRPSWLLILI
jgi:hypothetical protein